MERGGQASWLERDKHNEENCGAGSSSDTDTPSITRTGLTTNTGHLFAGLSTKQLPRCSLTCLREALVDPTPARISERRHSNWFCCAVPNACLTVDAVGLALLIQSASPVKHDLLSRELEVHLPFPPWAKGPNPMRLVYHRDDPTPTTDRLVAGDLFHFEPL